MSKGNIFKVLGTLACAIAMTQAAPTTTPSAPAPQARQSFRERYGTLSDHNIFMRERSRGGGARDREPSSSRSAFSSPEQTYVLRGIVLEAGERRAYVEDYERGGLLRMSVGDPIARGRVADIDIDSITYESSRGQRQWIIVGADLTGTAPTVASPEERLASTNPTTLPFDPNSPNLTIEQKMMLRRMQELKK